MTTAARGPGRRLWSVVLVVSVLTVIGAGWRLAEPAGGPEDADLAPAVGLATPTPSASPPFDDVPELRRRSTAELRARGSRPATPQRRTVTPPTALQLPRLDIRMPIRTMGVDDHGAMALPAQPSELGWYGYGPSPGDARGSAVLAGHVDSDRYGIGPLADLQEARVGDVVRVSAGDRTREFTVTAVQLLDKQRLPLDRLFDRDGPGVLRIVTCGGPYLADRGGYQANLVITAEPR